MNNWRFFTQQQKEVAGLKDTITELQERLSTYDDIRKQFDITSAALVELQEQVAELEGQVVDAILDCSNLHTQNVALQAQVEQMSYWLVNASVCPECGNSPLRANYSAGKATLRYCDRGGCGCGWKQAAIKGEK